MRDDNRDDRRSAENDGRCTVNLQGTALPTSCSSCVSRAMSVIQRSEATKNLTVPFIQSITPDRFSQTSNTALEDSWAGSSTEQRSIPTCTTAGT